MQSYTHKPAPVTLEAVQYAAPDADGSGGNVGELIQAGARMQHPWDPANGQDCLLLGYESHDAVGVLQSGDYLVVRPDGTKAAVKREDFESTFSPASSGRGNMPPAE